MIVAVVADTHVPLRAQSLPLSAWRAIAGAELILHAGDVCTAGLLEELACAAPVQAVMGNCDPPEVRVWGASDELVADLDGVRVAMIHDSGRREGRAERMRRRFPDAGVVVFGHSHMPVVERRDELLLLNPGSPTDRRRSPSHSVALLRISDGHAQAELVQLD